MENDLSCLLVIFGGTGDLTRRKLIPAIYNLAQGENLPWRFAVVAVANQEYSNDEYRMEMYESVRKYSRFEPDWEAWQRINNRINYESFDFHDDEGYLHLKDRLEQLDAVYQTGGRRIFYLAVAPEFFELIVEKLAGHGLAQTNESWPRVVIEKPFGRDLQSAGRLNQKITDVFTEKNTFRIDHYLGKEMLQNIMAIRFANAMFEPIWNSRFIDNIQITAAEQVGVETRATYYEQSGAIRDMVQNHLLQLLALTTMEPPVNLEAGSIRDEKVKIFRLLEQGARGWVTAPEMIGQNVIRGQYGQGVMDARRVRGYRQEERVDPISNTETFIAMKLQIENFRWGGTPFYIRTGKRLPAKSTEIIIEFKTMPGVLFREFGTLHPNLLALKIQPTEGVAFQFNAKNPGAGINIVPVKMDFCQNCREDTNSPEAYERLILEAMKGDQTLFTSWDEVEVSWKFVDQIIEVWDTQKIVFPNYPAGSWGPEAAQSLLTNDGRQWREI
jgi:glucose-6-phosphate 1-dehydrogenase